MLGIVLRNQVVVMIQSRRVFKGLVAAIAALWLSISPLYAGIPFTREMVCPYDDTPFQFHGQASGTIRDRTLDLRPVGPIESPWPIPDCPTNGFVFVKEEYSAEELEKLRALILSPEYRAIYKETSYYRAAWVLDRTGASKLEVSWMLLQATWQVSQSYVRYTGYATTLLAKLQEAVGGIDDKKQQVETKLLIGEILRRLGRLDDAARHFRNIRSDVDAASDEARIIAFQLHLIALRDISPHLMSEVFKHQTQ